LAGEAHLGYKQAAISGEELAVKVRDQVSDALDLRSLPIDLKLPER
jgi:hypothetical protein